MDPAREEAIARTTEAWHQGRIDPIVDIVDPGIVLDWSNSIGPLRGVYEGIESVRGLFENFFEAFAEVRWEARDPVAFGPDRLVLTTRLDVRGRESGVETSGRGAQVWTFAGDRVSNIKMFQSREEAVVSLRTGAIAEARLYLVCDALGSDSNVASLLDSALAGGTDIVQLRDRALSDKALIEAASTYRKAADETGALFIVNDRPDLVGACGADGVHVGQEDTSVDLARREAGAGAIVGLSTHSPEQLEAANSSEGEARPDYVSVGPVWETPTKPGRPATGLDYVRHAATNSTLPWFAIGGIDASNVAEVVDAGAARVVVVRAIRDAQDPEAAARALREALAAQPHLAH